MQVHVDGREVFAYSGSRAPVAGASTVMFVHGAAHDHGVFALQSRYFAHHGRNVLAVDLPGHGKSIGPALPTIEALADWIDAVLTAVDARESVLVGHSMGALATLECAARYPGRVKQLALLGPAAPMLVSDELLDAARRDEHLAFELINGWSFAAARQLGGNQVPGMWMTGNAMRLMERTAPGVLAADLSACRDYANGVIAAARVACPVLVIVGTRDLMAPARNAAALLDAFADKRVLTLADTGHSLMAEQPDAVLDGLRSFIR